MPTTETKRKKRGGKHKNEKEIKKERVKKRKKGQV